MKQYHDLCKRILREGTYKKDRTGVGTYSVTGAEIRFDLSKGFPLVTTKEVKFKKLVVTELFWFLRGDTNIRYLLQHGNHIWDEWPFKRWVESEEYKASGRPDMTDFGNRAMKDPEFRKVYKKVKKEFCQLILEDEEFAKKWGDCGRAYGAQWRRAFYVNPDTLEVSIVDPLAEAIEDLKTNPYSRRIVVSSFNQDNIRHSVLPCCHHQFQFIVRDGKLDLVWDQRSVDVFLGLSFNIASYALLTHMVAQVVGLEVGELIGHLKDVHIYSNHVDAVKELLSREPYELPTLWLNPEVKDIDDFTLEDIDIVNYKHHPPIYVDVAV